MKKKLAWIVIGILILFSIYGISKLKFSEEDYLVIISFTETPGWGTNYTENSFRTYDCRDLPGDYWMYPKGYDKVFNWAYEKCNESYPELFNITKKDDSGLMLGNGNLGIGNSSLNLKDSIFISGPTSNKELIRISSNDKNATEFSSPYLVELDMNNCRKIMCKQDKDSMFFNLNYCYVCDNNANVVKPKVEGKT